MHASALIRPALCALAGAVLGTAGARAEAQATVALRGRVIDRPSVRPDGSTRLYLYEPTGRLPKSTTTLRFAPLFSDSFADAARPRWHDLVGITAAGNGMLVADSERNMVVVADLPLQNGKVTADFRSDAVAGILLRVRDPANLILAFYSPGPQVTGFHEVTDGNLGPWLSPVPTRSLSRAGVHMEVRIDGRTITSTLTDGAGARVSTAFTPAVLTSPGLVGLYHDRSVGPRPQEYSGFAVYRSERVPLAGTVSVALPAAVARALGPVFRGDPLQLRGREQEVADDASRAVVVGRTEDIAMLTRRTAAATLFPTDLPGPEWHEFRAAGFSERACGVIYRSGDTVTNGVALGGVDTGCLDLETSGLWGYCTLFNTHVPRRGPLNLPFLGLNTCGQTWVLCGPQVKHGEGGSQTPLEPGVAELPLDGVGTADEIHYWGHYPVADLEFVTEAPVHVGLRAWSPFLPGDVASSMLPGIILEVHLRNGSGERQAGTLAFSFPGPTPREAGSGHFERRPLTGPVRGVSVAGALASYALGVVTRDTVRTGGELGASGAAWAGIGESLPAADPEEPGASVAVGFDLAPGRAQTVRFLLTWCAPTWKGGGYNGAEAGHTFTHMYAQHYPDPVSTAERLARDHASLLRRVLAWQQAIYTDEALPVWLRDSLVNVLYMITEDGYWAQAGPPLPEWVRPEDGLFGMNECPRGCPQIECLPCSFYGSLPLAYFFPELQLSTIRGYAGYQLPDGAPPWIFGGCTGQTPPIDFACPTRGYQFATNGISLAAIVDRFLLCRDTADRSYLHELYPMVKRSVEHTVGLRTTPAYSLGERIISMPDGNVGTEWFEAEAPGWAGMTAHVGGLHLAEIRIAERLARLVGDTAFERQCAEWIRAGTDAMERRLWDGRGYYLNYLEPDTGRKSEYVFGYQLDGEWIAAHHGLAAALPEERIKTVLATVQRCNVRVTRYGAVNYASPDGTVANPGGYGAYSYFPPELLMLAMTYMYHGDREFGLELAHKAWHNLVCRQGYTWDMPNIMRGDVDTGERTFGNDYYQDMMLWSLPAALAGQDVSAPCRPGGLVDRVLRAAGGR